MQLKSLRSIKTESEARDAAIEWQEWQADRNLTYGELVYFQNYFENLAKKFNLTEEFIENGII
jgi:hypothetical protein